MNVSKQITYSSIQKLGALNVPEFWFNARNVGRAIADIRKGYYRLEEGVLVNVRGEQTEVRGLEAHARVIDQKGAPRRYTVGHMQGQIVTNVHKAQQIAQGKARKEGVDPSLAVSKHPIIKALLEGREVHVITGNRDAARFLVKEGAEFETQYLERELAL